MEECGGGKQPSTVQAGQAAEDAEGGLAGRDGSCWVLKARGWWEDAGSASSSSCDQ